VGQASRSSIDVSAEPSGGSRPRVERNRAGLSFWLALYRDQARLIWEWRATRMSLIRRGLLSYLAAIASILVVATYSGDLTVDGPRALVLAALVLTGANAVARPALLLALAPLPTIAVQLAGLVVEVFIVLAMGQIVPGVGVGSLEAAVVDAVWLTVLNAILAEILRASDDHSYHGTQVRRLAAREFGKPPRPTSGLLMIQLDGLGREVLENQMRAGRMATLDRLVRSGRSRVDPWFAFLPPVTPVSQAGILHGSNDDMPGFRWYEKSSRTLLVANTPEGASEILRRRSDGHGLLADDGASIGNLLTGDAARDYLTMATIEDAPSPDDPRRLRGIFVSQVNYIRLTVLTIGEIAKELYQRERQRARGVEPRIHRNLHYALERALTNVALRNLTTALVIEEMFGSAPAIYVDYTGYDAIAHHAGPERAESVDALDGLDRTLASLLKAAQETPRPYRLVVLSDHGQCLGTPFSQIYGELLEDTTRRLMGVAPGAAAVGTGSWEYQGLGRLVLHEVGRGRGVRSAVARRAARRRRADPAAPTTSGPDDALVACASGNLALLYLMVSDDRVAREEIDRLYPSLIPGLLAHPGVGVILVHSSAHGSVALGPTGEHYLASGRIVGDDPLPAFGPLAAESLARLDGFANVGDIVVIGPYDPTTGDVVSYEDLVGSHGGLGGRQQEPFLLHPVDLPLADAPLVGAPAVHAQLRSWLEALKAGQPGTATTPATEPDVAQPADEPRPVVDEPAVPAAAAVANPAPRP
jgi:uncharacterized membrane protein YvlD (DUF360 family)